MEKEEWTVLVLGTGAVGKSSLSIRFVDRFVDQQFPEDYDPTIEENYRILATVDDQECMLHVVDTAGVEELQSMSAFPTADGHLLVYSISDRASFEALPNIHLQIAVLPNVEARPTVVAANKTDLDPQHHVVSRAEGETFASEINASFFETSAKMHVNVDAAFHQLVRSIRSSRSHHTLSDSSTKKACTLM